MAKKVSPAKSATSGRKRAATKPKVKTAARKPARKPASARGGPRDNAVDALLKLLESPLVADLLAVGASAAMAAITESRHTRRTGADAKSGKTAKAAGKAAAAAIGRRLSTEFEEIKKAATKPRTTAKS
ncbi:MAG: hypothetical protein ABI626_10270 [Sphingomicrobium sp.]